MNARFQRSTVLAAIWMLAAAATAFADAETDERRSYSYVRSVDGRASLVSFGRGPGEEVDLHQILQRGDRVRVERGARLEIVLADRNLLRVAGGTDLALVRVAFSADGDDRATRIDLTEGEIGLTVTDRALGDELPEVRTEGAEILVREPGTFRIRASVDGVTEAVVRSGSLELVTERGSTIVRADEEAWTSSDRYRGVEVGAAGPRDALERWGEELDEGTRSAQERLLHVEPELAYAAAPMADYGNWQYVDSSWYWRPRVASGWRPYWDGRWTWSPSGMTWVSNEPWGWVPYHYGTWSNLPGYGWAWCPGRVYSPAWVYWYWSRDWAGWCPTGYYSQYYGAGWSSGLRFGLYGWTGGNWGLYADWNFLPTVRVCDRYGSNFRRSGIHLARTVGLTVPQGILTTDTRALPRDRWDRPDELLRALERTPRGRGVGGELPTVTDFVARKRDLPDDVRRAVTPDPDQVIRLRERPEESPVARRGDTGRQPTAGVSGGEPVPGWRQRDPTDPTGATDPTTRTRVSERPRTDASDRGTDVRGTSPDRTQGDRSYTPRGVLYDSEHPRQGPSTEPADARRSGYDSNPPVPSTPRDLRASNPDATGDRQGWRSQSGVSLPDNSQGGREPQPIYGTPSFSREEPVERVIGGVRRGVPVEGRSGSPTSYSVPRYGVGDRFQPGPSATTPPARFTLPGTPALPGSATARPGYVLPGAATYHPVAAPSAHGSGSTVASPSAGAGARATTPPPSRGSQGSQGSVQSSGNSTSRSQTKESSPPPKRERESDRGNRH